MVLISFLSKQFIPSCIFVFWNLLLIEAENNRNMQKQHILIANISSQLSQQLVEELRDDHLVLQSAISMMGISSNDKPFKQEDSTTPLAIMNYDDDPNRVLKLALQSDIVVLDLLNDQETAELIIKFLTSGGDEKKRKVIGVSSYMTWAGQTSCQINHEEDFISALTIEQQIKQQTDSDFNQRKTPPRMRHLRDLQNQLLLLNECPNTSACIISAGLIYGKAFTSLQWYFQQSLIEHSALVCFGSGNNLLPMIHISDLAKSIDLLAKSNSLKKNYIAVDDSTMTQLQLVNTLKRQLQNQEEIQFKSLEYITPMEALMSANVKLLRSPELDQIEWKSREGISGVLAEFLTFRDFEFKKIVINDDLAQDYDESLENICKQSRILLLNHKFITNFLLQIQQGKISNDDLLPLIIEQRKIFDEQRETKIAQHEQEKKNAAKKKVGKSDTKLKSVNQIPMELVFSNELVRKALEILVNASIHKSIIIDLSEQARRQLTVLQKFAQMTIDQAQQLINPSKKNAKSREAITIPEATRRCSYGGVSIQQQMDQIVSQEGGQTDDFGNFSQKKLHHRTSKKQLPQQDRMKRNINCRQYLTDLVMPVVSHALNQIETTKPKDIVKAFIELLKEQAEVQDCIYQ